MRFPEKIEVEETFYIIVEYPGDKGMRFRRCLGNNIKANELAEHLKNLPGIPTLERKSLFSDIKATNQFIVGTKKSGLGFMWAQTKEKSHFNLTTEIKKG